MITLKIMSTLLFALVIYKTAAFQFTCPEPSEKILRSKGLCTDYRNYTCLFDENSNSFSENCSVKFDFQRPGYRVTIRTNLHAGFCPEVLYQPFIFFTNKSSNCELKRSFCNEEGQIISSNGTSTMDRKCRCNYAQDYTYVTKPANIYSCIPSEEDCSCYLKQCSKDHILSPDHECIDQFSWRGQYLCPSNLDLRLPKETGSGNEIHSTEVQKDLLQSIDTTALLVIIFVAILLLTYYIGFLLKQDIADFLKRICYNNDEYQYGSDVEISPAIEVKSPTEAQITTNVNESFPQIQTETQALVEIKTKEDHEERFEILGPYTQVKDGTEIENEKDKFIETDIIRQVKEQLLATDYIVLWGQPGCGKTTSIRHIASHLQNRVGYKVIFCHKPSDLFNNNGTEKRLFVVDDICGRFVFSFERFLRWKRREKHIERLIQTDNVKLLMTCSSAVYMTATVQTFSLFTTNAIELTIPNMSLKDLHEDLIKDLELSQPFAHNLFDQLPLAMIKLGRYLHSTDAVMYFNDSSQFVKSKVVELRESNFSAFCSLFLVTLKQGCIEEFVLTSDDQRMFTVISSHVCKTLNVDMSRRRFFDNLFFLMDIFITKENGSFSIKHTDIFEVLAVYFGETLQELFIRNADPEIITQHCSLENCPPVYDETLRFSIQVKEENEIWYFERIKHQLLLGNICEVFSIRQMKFPLFHQKLAAFLRKLGTDVVIRISRSKCKKESETTFTLARRNAYVDLLKLFFECDTNLSLEDYPYLEIACQTNNINFVRFLISKEININKHTSDGSTALHIACKNGFLSMIFLLISKGGDVNCRDNNGNTPLIQACNNDNKKVVSLLLDNGVDINKSNDDGQVPLMIAATKKTNKIVDLLLKKYADVNKVDCSGLTCLMYAIISEFENRETIMTLLKAGVDSNVSAVDGKTALMMALQMQRYDKDIIIILTNYATNTKVNDEKANNINKCDNRGITPLIYACILKSDIFDIVVHLVSKGAIVNCCDYNDRTPLIVALYNDDDILVEYLLKHNANVNLPGEKSTTPLHEVCKSGQYNKVSLLISKGSKIDIVDRQNMTPLMLACKYGYLEITEVLIKNNAKIDAVDNNGTTALMLACKGGFDDIIRVLVEHGADVNKKDKFKMTALLAYADSQFDHAEIVDFLIGKGAEINSSTQDEVSSLMMACSHGHIKIVKCLLQHNVDVNHKNIYGKTAIFSACLSGDVDIVHDLIAKEADTGVIDTNGDTLASLIRKADLTEMVDVFSKSK